MKKLNTERVKKLYADADHWTENHPRQDLQEAEFAEWLTARDEALITSVLQSLDVDVAARGKQSGDQRAWDYTKIIQDRIEDITATTARAVEAIGKADD